MRTLSSRSRQPVNFRRARYLGKNRRRIHRTNLARIGKRCKSRAAYTCRLSTPDLWFSIAPRWTRQLHLGGGMDNAAVLARLQQLIVGLQPAPGTNAEELTKLQRNLAEQIATNPD